MKPKSTTNPNPAKTFLVRPRSPEKTQSRGVSLAPSQADFREDLSQARAACASAQVPRLKGLL